MAEPAIDITQIDSLADMLGEDVKDGETIMDVPVNDLKRGQFQPRQKLDENGLKSFADSIKSQGVIQPLLIRRLPDGSLEIVAGERRWRAAIIAGLTTVPCVLREIDDTAALAAALVENIDRENMPLVDEALGVFHLVERTSSKDAAKILGKKAQWLSKRVKIAQAPQYIIDFANMGLSTDVEGLYQLSRLSESDEPAARSLVDLWKKDPTSRVSLRQQVLDIQAPKKPKNKGSDKTGAKDPDASDPSSDNDETGASKPKRTKKTPAPPINLHHASVESDLLVFKTNEGVLRFKLGAGAKESVLEALNTL